MDNGVVIPWNYEMEGINIMVVIRIVIALLLMFSSSKVVMAQISSMGIGYDMTLSGDIPDSSVLCAIDDRLEPCSDAYHSHIIGVVSDNPAFAVAGEQIEGRLVVSSGTTLVRVSLINGLIRLGDPITSSSQIGVAQKADRNGVILGMSMASMPVDVEEAIIPVLIDIRYASQTTSHRSNLTEMLRQGIASPVAQPLDSLRYVLAVLLVLISFGMGFFYYGRMATTGVEAIGRNPLAKDAIRMSVFMNMLVSGVIVLVGLGSAYLVLVL